MDEGLAFRDDSLFLNFKLLWMAANEASAVASLHTHDTAIVAYQTTYATDPTTNFVQLGPVSGVGLPSASAADLVDSLLGAATPVKSGYSFTYTPVAAMPVTRSTILAVPSYTSTGQRRFFTDQSGVIRQTTDGSTPTVTSAPIG